MKLLSTNRFPAVSLTSLKSKDVWLNSLQKSDAVKMATGYVSFESLVELKRIIEANNAPKVDLLIGMHYFEKFTERQYKAVCELNSFLNESKLGTVYLSDKTKFHGKIYSFIRESKCFCGIIGSSNLTSFCDNTSKLFEVDCCFSNEEEASKIDNKLTKIIDEIGVELAMIPPIEEFKEEKNTILHNQEGVEAVDESNLKELKNSRTGVKFLIPVKTTPKSNLNTCFGKGRENKNTGYIIPRPWYEVELIVSKSITDLPNFPKNKKITVFTDDNWSFQCESHGDFGKNFRSSADLKILGRWIKGKLEFSGALRAGQPVTDEVLAAYGKDYILLEQTIDTDKWLITY